MSLSGVGRLDSTSARPSVRDRELLAAGIVGERARVGLIFAYAHLIAPHANQHAPFHPTKVPVLLLALATHPSTHTKPNRSPDLFLRMFALSFEYRAALHLLSLHVH